jgi:hypothetical protein
VIVGNPAPLDQFYYLKNFETVLGSLRERYADLLSNEEHGFMDRFGAMPLVARALLVRMVMRKGELFRASKLRYPEIGETHAAATPLAQAGWVDVEPHLTLEELQALLTKPELVRHFVLPGRATVHYVENGLINSLFGLLCWRAIFAPIAGAFFHDFHRGPADLSSAEFYRRREREFAACFAELESGSYQVTIRETYTLKIGIQSPFVAWNLLSESLLEHALVCLPADHLRHWFEWIARDVPRNRAGFPDLIQLWPRERRYRMIEVKGPGDRLQDNQRRLLQFCAAHRMPVAVCYVRWARPSVAQS